MLVVMQKAHVDGYTRKDGVVVSAHEDSRHALSFDKKLPSSEGISSESEAAHYWRENFAGKTVKVTVHSGGKEIPIRVRFDSSNTHAFTSDSGGKQKTGERRFDPKRAKAMGRILSTIEHPKARARNYQADLMFESAVSGEHFTVVLTWRAASKVYEFHSAHFKPIEEVRRLWKQQDARKNEGPLQKSEPSSVFAGLLDSTESGDSLRWLPPFLDGNGMHKPIMCLVKAHVKAHVRKDGTLVKDYETKVQPKQHGLFGFGGFYSKNAMSNPKAYHPQANESGKKVGIIDPHKPSDPAAWENADSTVTVTPGSAVPAALNGIPFAPWADAPKTEQEWENVPGQADIDEPPLEIPLGKKAATGVVVMEPDGRVWVVCPTNAFGGYENTFPKGKHDNDEMSLQANAVKECFEESGLQVEIDSFLGDMVRTTSVARYYLARRVGGTPSAMGWESQAVQLVPKKKLAAHMDTAMDKKIAGWVEGL